MDLMPIEHIADWERRLERQDAFWEREVIDRPVVCFSLPKKNPDHPWPAEKQWASIRDRWMDTAYQAELGVARVRNTEYFGDALPGLYPQLGPEVFSSFFGCEMEYGETTSWSIPNLHNWKDVGQLQLSEDNFYWKKLVEMTDAFLEAGRGTFYTGMTDWHPGGDAIAAFRDPADLNVDMIEHLDEVKALLRRVNDTYFKVFDFFCDRLTAAGQALTTWMPIVSTRKWYVPSNDFSCMISKEMFDDVFLPGIAEECRFLDRSVYHLDGPGALQHLDSLLDITELDALQWVFGAGNGPASRWMDLYQRVQAAGKGIQIGLDASELDFFMESLRPGGMWIGLSGIEDREHADATIKKLASW